MDFNILLIVGAAIFGGVIFGKIFTKLKFPQVVGFIILGIILGKTGFKFIDDSSLEMLKPINSFALGLIGFMVGSELDFQVIKKYGKQFISILLFEGISAFIIVTSLTGVVLSFFIDQTAIVWSVAILLGAISSATAPAATTDVLWENKTKGPLTRTILGIVALDDGLALILFALASSVASILIGTGTTSIGEMLLHPLYEIGVSIICGIVCGLVLMKLNKLIDGKPKKLSVSIGFLCFSLGIAIVFKLDMLLLAMTIGATLVNVSKRDSEEILHVVEQFAPPINTLFFVLIGASLSVTNLSYVTVILVLTYFVGRTSGKMLGAYVGAVVGKAPFTVKKFLPFCLFSQAGVAVGLSILAGEKFTGEVGSIITITITASTFIVQILGPIAVKYAVVKAKEVGLNVTDADILTSHYAADVISKDFIAIDERASLKQVIEVFGDNDNFNFPVLNSESVLEGIITIDNLKDTLVDRDELEFFIIASDLVDDDYIDVKNTDTLEVVFNRMEKEGYSFVVVNDSAGKFLNVLDRREIQSFIKRKTLTSSNRANRLDKISGLGRL